jgi:hypothetical protein
LHIFGSGLFIGDNFFKIVDVIFFVLVTVKGQRLFEELFRRKLRCFFVTFDKLVSCRRRS